MSGFVEYAGFWKRFVAFGLDYVLFLIISDVLGMFFGVLLVLSLPNVSGQELLNMINKMEVVFTIGGMLLFWLYYALMESTYGATLGKMAIGIKVTDMDGNMITFLNATGRHFAKFLSGLVLCIGYIMAGFTEKKQGLHDMLASTLVVNK